jgi:hypothetical protein
MRSQVINQTRDFFLYGVKPHGALDEVDQVLRSSVSYSLGTIIDIIMFAVLGTLLEGATSKDEIARGLWQRYKFCHPCNRCLGWFAVRGMIPYCTVSAVLTES